MTYERDHEREQRRIDRDDSAASMPGRASSSAALTGPQRPMPSGILLRKSDGGELASGADAAVAVAATSSGAALPDDLRTRFEASLGTDLSSVRVHTGEASEVATSAVSARAYATGSDIHFAASQYDPSSGAGQHLIAHEVAHTVQQRGGTATRQHKLAVSQAHDALEIEADRAADAMVAGMPAQVSGGGLAIARDPAAQHAPPPPPGMQILKNLQPVAAAVKAGEASGTGSIPSPAGLYNVAERNYNASAQHCTNVQSHYAAKAGGVDVPLVGELGANANFKKFASTAGEANKYCETGAVHASAASAAISMWVPLLQSSQDNWADVKKAAEKANIETVANDDGSTSLDGEGVAAEGEQLKGNDRLVNPKQVDAAPANATPQQKADTQRRKESSDKDIADGKNIKSESKVLLNEASTNFEQSVADVTGARRNVVTSHGAARRALLDSKVKANQKRQSAAEGDKKNIEEILALVDKAQAAIEKGRGVVETMDKFTMGEPGGAEAIENGVASSVGGIKASAVAKMVLQLDGTIPTIEGEIAACKSRDSNLKDIIDEGAIASAGAKYTDALKAFKGALAKLPDRITKYEAAHKAYAESVNQALMKRGVIKPGEDGVKPMMELLAKVRVAIASTSAASAATGDVQAAVGQVNELGAPPQPDVCRLSDMATAHAAAFKSAPKHVTAIQGVLTNREAKLKAYLAQIGI